MAKRKPKPQTVAELRREILKYVNPLVARVNEHDADLSALDDDVSGLRAVDSKLAKCGESLAAEVADLRKRLAIDADGTRDRERNTAIQLRNLYDSVDHLEIRWRRFGARLRWLLTGK